MKKFCFALVLSLLFFQTSEAQTEVDSTGFPGDHFSLQGAIEVFRNSKSPEDFEKKLNEEKSYVNNLDLNEDGEIDYIRVVDNMDEDVHAIVLQVPVSETESQDIAVIEIEKTGKETAILQIIGDEDIYGQSTIIEPFEEETKNSGKGGPSAGYEVGVVVLNVWGWSCVGFIYAPRYRAWVSPYGWKVYPRGWRPWRPHPFRWHYGRRVHYHNHCHRVSTHRVVRAHRVYTPRRTRSVTVVNRTTTVRVAKKSNNQVVRRKTTTTKVAGKNRKGNVVAGKKTTTTKVAKKGNKVGAKRKTTKVKGRKKN